MREPLPTAPIFLKLLQGVMYYDDKHWEMLLVEQNTVCQQFSQLGLQLHLDESEGYAYLTQPTPEDEKLVLPRLVRRRSLSYEATLLTVLLRQALQQFDTRDIDLDRFVLTYDEIREMMRIFYKEQPNMTRIDQRIHKAMTQVEDVGFLKKLNSDNEERYEVRRIIKAKVPADLLQELLDNLKQKLLGEEGT